MEKKILEDERPSKGQVIEIYYYPNAYKKTFLPHKCSCGNNGWRHVVSRGLLVCANCQNEVFISNFPQEFGLFWKVAKKGSKSKEVQYDVLFY